MNGAPCQNGEETIADILVVIYAQSFSVAGVASPSMYSEGRSNVEWGPTAQIGQRPQIMVSFFPKP